MGTIPPLGTRLKLGTEGRAVVESVPSQKWFDVVLSRVKHYLV